MNQYALIFLIAVASWLVIMVIGAYRAWKSAYVKVHGARAPPPTFWAFLIWQFRPLKRRQMAQRGAMNIGGIMLLGIGMVFLAIGFIFLPISTTATQGLLDYAYSACASITDESYTGFTAVVGITPLLILVGFLTAAVVTGMMGVKIMKGAGTGKADPGSLMLLGLSIVFIAIGLIIEPVALDGISSVLYGGGTGIAATFIGYESIILISPMLVHLSFLAAAVLSGFFGIKKLGSATDAGD